MKNHEYKVEGTRDEVMQTAFVIIRNEMMVSYEDNDAAVKLLSEASNFEHLHQIMREFGASDKHATEMLCGYLAFDWS